MPKKEKPSIDQLIEEISANCVKLAEAIPDHKDVFNDIENAIYPIIGKTRSQVTVEEMQVLYHRAADAINYLLHVQGENVDYKEKYWADLVTYRNTYKQRLDFIGNLLGLINRIDPKNTDDKMMKKWETAAKEAKKAVDRFQDRDRRTEGRFPDYINTSFDAIEKIRNYFVDMYDRVLKRK